MTVPESPRFVVSAGMGTQHYANAPDGKTLCGKPIAYVSSGKFIDQLDCQKCRKIAARKRR